MLNQKTLITGANGQLGKALWAEFPNAEFTTREELDITNPTIAGTRDWKGYGVIINAAAYTAVDQAESSNGRRDAWNVNAHAVAHLSRIASEYGITLVHISSDYVFDGSVSFHEESETFSPLGVYGQSKAAGDIAASITPKHYILRSTWITGEGKNFVRIMQSLAEKGIKPSVVSDQIGRLTFTEDLAKGIKHLLEKNVAYGTYNLSNEGEHSSWADIAKTVYELSGKAADDITPVKTTEYFKDKPDAAPRPLQSMLNLDKIKSTGFVPREWRQALKDYLES